MKIRILDANLWLIPYLAREINKRLDKFVILVKSLDPDIICLQEVWLNKYINYMHDRLSEYKVMASNSVVRNRSGLVILSKTNLLAAKIIFYPVLSGFSVPELLASKGIISVVVQLGNKKLKLVNTHLYAGKTDRDKKFKRTQLSILSDMFNDKSNLVLCGDLNYSPNEIPRFLNNFQKDDNADVTWEITNPYSKVGSQLTHIVNNRKSDYILVGKAIENVKFKTTVIRKPLISDHYALIMDLDFDNI